MIMSSSTMTWRMHLLSWCWWQSAHCLASRAMAHSPSQGLSPWSLRRSQAKHLSQLLQWQ